MKRIHSGVKTSRAIKQMNRRLKKAEDEMKKKLHRKAALKAKRKAKLGGKLR